jgi:hypothetical protein
MAADNPDGPAPMMMTSRTDMFVDFMPVLEHRPASGG